MQTTPSYLVQQRCLLPSKRSRCFTGHETGMQEDKMERAAYQPILGLQPDGKPGLFGDHNKQTFHGQYTNDTLTSVA